MMNNVTAEHSSTISFFHRYLLGDSLRNSFIRLTVILSAIIIVWCGIMLALIIHMKCQRAKQILKTSNTHHHLYDSSASLTKRRSTRSRRNRRFNSSSSSLSSTRCYSIRRVLSHLKQRCIFWPSSPTTTVTRIETMPKNSSIKTQLIVETITKNPFIPIPNIVTIGKKISLYRETDSSSGDELKNLHSIENEQNLPMEIHPTIIIQPSVVNQEKSCIHRPSISHTINENQENNKHEIIKRIEKYQQLNSKPTSFLHPIIRRLSNTNSCIPPVNTIQKHKPLLMISSARELTSNPEWKWQHSVIDDPLTADGSRTSSSRHIPVVMITDTSSSNTNIVELETFEDHYRLLGDIERRLSHELRATYRPRHST